MTPSRRMNRVDELLKEEIARVIRKDVADPRVGFATVMDVETSPDLRHARVFVSVYGEEEAKSEAIETLRNASGYVRARVGEMITLKYLPELRFELDRTVERAARIDALIDEVREARERREGAGDEEPGEEEPGGEADA